MRSRGHVDYDEVAATYDQRYARGAPVGIAEALVAIATDIHAERVLEVGCGTGQWLAALAGGDRRVYGVDLSNRMLEKARTRAPTLALVRGHADRLAFAQRSFDLVFCVHALHHFDDPRRFVSAAHDLLRPGGVLAIIGLNPHAGRDRWYIYDYFPGTHETDLSRYPSPGTITDWMIAAGFTATGWQVAAHILDTRVGRAVWDDPILQKNGTSQLTLLSEEAYAAGRARIEATLVRAEQAQQPLMFPVDISLALVWGRVAKELSLSGNAR